MYKLIDTHVHFEAEHYPNLDATISESLASLDCVVNVSYDLPSSISSKALSERYDQIYYSVGIHPNYCKDFKVEDISNLKKLVSKKCVAIGEIGLDYYRDFTTKEEQKVAFHAQIKLAEELDLPIIIHGREAYEDILEILAQYSVKFVMHSYAGSYELVQSFLDRAFVSFSGLVTYNKVVQDCAKKIPSDKFVVETDSPYLTPMQHRGKQNKPMYVRHVAEAIAVLRNDSFENIVEQSHINSKKLFNLS